MNMQALMQQAQRMQREMPQTPTGETTVFHSRILPKRNLQATPKTTPVLPLLFMSKRARLRSLSGKITAW